MKKIHTPISSSIGNHEMKICARKLCSSSGLASTLTPYLTQVADHPDVAGAVGDVASSCRSPTHVIVRPSIVADSTLPGLAWSMNSE